MSTSSKIPTRITTPRDPGNANFLYVKFSTGWMFTPNYSMVRVQDELLPQNTAFVRDIQEMSRLPVNWDSYNAAMVSSKSIAQAIRFVKALDAIGLTPHVVSPGPNEEVMVMLRNPNGDELECIFYPERTVFVWFMKGEKPWQRNVTQSDWVNILKEWFVHEIGR